VSRGREAALLGLVLAVAAGAMLAFGLLDRRDPNDHDGFYSNELIEQVGEYQRAETAAERRTILKDEALWLGTYPPVGRVAMVWTLGTFGTSRAAFRLSNLPFIVLLAFGTWLLGRELGGPRVGLLAAALVIAVPTMVVHSRKFAPPWFSAALTPLTWALLLLALRLEGRRGWAAAVAAGLVQGLRCYTHPIVYPDVGMSSALVVLWAAGGWWRDRTRARLLAIARVGAAGALALLLASHILGWGPLGLPPEYSFPRYQASRSHVLTGGLSASALLGAASLGVRSWFHMHLMPVGFVLAAVGLVAALRRSLLGAPGHDRAAARMLWLAILAQIPLALMTISRGTFTSDWMQLIPGACVLAAWGVFGPGGPAPRAAKAWGGGAVAHSAGVLVLPLVLSFVGPSPYQEPGWYVEGPGRAFAESSSGGLWNTHHIPIREPGAFRRLTRLLARPAAGGQNPNLADLRLLGADTSTPCRPTMGPEARWVWGDPLDQAIGNRWWSPWPPLITGIPRVEPGFTTDGSIGHGDWRVEPRPGDEVTAWLGQGRRAVVVRLWTQLDKPTREAWRHCLPSQPDRPTIDSARDLLESLMPDHTVTNELMDLGAELVGMEDGRLRDPMYAAYALYLTPI